MKSLPYFRLSEVSCSCLCHAKPAEGSVCSCSLFSGHWHLHMGSSSQCGPSVETLFPYHVRVDLMVSVTLPEHLCYQGLCSCTFV